MNIIIDQVNKQALLKKIMFMVIFFKFTWILFENMELNSRFLYVNLNIIEDDSFHK